MRAELGLVVVAKLDVTKMEVRFMTMSLMAIKLETIRLERKFKNYPSTKICLSSKRR